MSSFCILTDDAGLKGGELFYHYERQRGVFGKREGQEYSLNNQSTHRGGGALCKGKYQDLSATEKKFKCRASF